MIDDLRQAFISMIDEATWMDEATKMAAREKAAAMKQFLAYPDWIKNSTALDYHYQEVFAHQIINNLESPLRLVATIEKKMGSYFAFLFSLTAAFPIEDQFPMKEAGHRGLNRSSNRDRSVL